MQNINLAIPFNNKLLESVSTRVPSEIKDLVDELAKTEGSDRAKWIREAIDLKLQVDLGQSSTELLKKSKNTAYSSEYVNVFKSIFSVFQISKKPDVRDRALSNVH
ncbi:ribbon-helix-helix domain-containing protein [Acinetobacter modestus]|uniref:ribbon-helix-helix domain-containing protein n=1 Tax=Acinetobacter modestus TaxID=1776740 RepID=UPI001F4AB1CC|nr:ribbon-helix-helix domain-containing protein [Acinetobacter modestus]MCH7331475.1 ribbon-helix-helix domain-containing protein [Acinetobacter modestus]